MYKRCVVKEYLYMLCVCFFLFLFAMLLWLVAFNLMFIALWFCLLLVYVIWKIKLRINIAILSCIISVRSLKQICSWRDHSQHNTQVGIFSWKQEEEIKNRNCSFIFDFKKWPQLHREIRSVKHNSLSSISLKLIY